MFFPFTMLRLVSLKSVLRKATDDTGIALSLSQFLQCRFQLRPFGSPKVAAVPAAVLPHVLVFLVDAGGRATRACQLGLSGRSRWQATPPRPVSTKWTIAEPEFGRRARPRASHSPLLQLTASVVQISMFFSLVNARSGWAKPENGEVLFELLQRQ